MTSPVWGRPALPGAAMSSCVAVCLLLLGAGCVVPGLEELMAESPWACDEARCLRCEKVSLQAYLDADGDGHGARDAVARSF
jgi:hypothetical protein